MGTNYYIRKAIRPSKLEELKKLVNEKDIYDGTLQEALGEFKEIHIGKSSCGWQFCFDHNNWKYYNQDKDSINAFIQKELDAGGSFVNEYGDSITLDDFWKMVDSKKDGFNQDSYYKFAVNQYNHYQSHPEEYEGKIKPEVPYLYPQYFTELISDDGLRFANSTDFC